jgi:hypothetical protein
MTLLANARINRLPALAARLDRVALPPRAPLHDVRGYRVSTRTVAVLAHA